MGREREGKGGEECVYQRITSSSAYCGRGGRGKGEGGVWREEDNRWMDDMSSWNKYILMGLRL